MHELLKSRQVSPQRTQNGIGDLFPREPSIFAQPSSGVRYTVNITDDFDRPSTFDQLVALLGSATEDDEIVFNINSNGGYIDTLNMLLGWKALCPARQVHVLMGNASSAGSAFFLSKADQYIVGEGATMMIHEFQSGLSGTQSNNERRNAHSSAENKKFITKTYAHFLSEEEVAQVLLGVEIYLDSDEIHERLAKRLDRISGSITYGEKDIDINEELAHFKEYLKTLSKDEVLKELEDMEKFQQLAKEALADLDEKA